MADNDLNEVIEETVDESSVITVPIDTTLSNSGEAADAKAVGDALALKADASSVVAITVNGESPDNQGAIIIDGEDIKMSSSDNTTIKAKISAVDAKTGADIPVSSAAGASTIAQAISDAGGKTANDIPMSSAEGAASIGTKIAAMDVVANQNSTDISALKLKAGDTIKVSTDSDETIEEALEACVKTVNGNGPDETGNVEVVHALTADNLTSAQSQNSIGEFNRRTTGGSASVQDGSAWMSSIRGNRTHVGYVPEALNMTVNTAPREEGETPITATLDHDTFVAYVENTSGTYTMTYTTSWSTSPALYGVTVTGDPVSGDQISIVFTAEDRGTIIQSDPQSFISTGYNLYDHDVGYAIGLKYSSTYGFRIAGTYTAVKFSSTIDGAKTTLLPVDGAFDIPSNGYIWVEGGNSTDTEVYMTWADWQLGRTGSWAAYSESEIDLSDVMEEYFPNGLLRVGDIRDEIDFNTGMAISNVQRLAYSAENLATAEASGLTYECDTDYIYLERATAVTNDIELDGQYTVNDHGLEYFVGSDVAVYAIVIYGNNLKNKLERDVLTKSADVLSVFSTISTSDTDKALSAAAGKELSDQIAIVGGILKNTTSVTSLWALAQLVEIGNKRTYAISPTSITYTDWPTALSDYKFYAFVDIYMSNYCVIKITAIKSSNGKTKNITGYRAGTGWVWEDIT